MELSVHTSTAVSGSSAELMVEPLQWSVIDRFTGVFSLSTIYGR